MQIFKIFSQIAYDDLFKTSWKLELKRFFEKKCNDQLHSHLKLAIHDLRP